jgi:hypothetical protein
MSKSPVLRRRLLEALLRDHTDADLPRLALRRRHDLRVPQGLLLACGGDAGWESAARGLAGRVSQAVLIEMPEAQPPHAAVVVPAPVPSTWRHTLGVAEREGARHGCVVLPRPPATGLRALRCGYHRAVADAALALAARVPGPLVAPGDLVIPRMLALLDSVDQRALLTPLLPILSLPAVHRAAYLHTLEVLRRTGSSLAHAAAELHLHPNSVRYRIDRIEDMTGLRLGDPADRMALDLAVILVRLRGHPLPEDGGASFGLEVMDSDPPRRWMPSSGEMCRRAA